MVPVGHSHAARINDAVYSLCAMWIDDAVLTCFAVLQAAITTLRRASASWSTTVQCRWPSASVCNNVMHVYFSMFEPRLPSPPCLCSAMRRDLGNGLLQLAQCPVTARSSDELIDGMFDGMFDGIFDRISKNPSCIHDC